MEVVMQIKQCRFILNTLNRVAEKNKLPVKPRIYSRIFLDNTAASANPYTAEINLNKIFSLYIFRPLIKRIIKHESKHIEQYQIMARYFAGLSKNIDKGLNNFKGFILQKFPYYNWLEFNERFYKQTIAKDGVIKKGHPLFKKAKEYVKALRQYPDMSPFNDLEVLSEKGVKEMFKNKWHKKKLYKSNFLEKEARMAEKQK